MADTDRSRPQWLIPAGIGLLVLALVVIALAREPVQLDPGSPEGTVQRYLQAISEEDYPLAFDLLDPAEFEDCVPADLAQYPSDQPFTANLDEARTDIFDDDTQALVSVTLRFGTEGLFDSAWESTETFELVSDDGSWLITGQPWPHFYWQCEERSDR